MLAWRAGQFRGLYCTDGVMPRIHGGKYHPVLRKKRSDDLFTRKHADNIPGGIDPNPSPLALGSWWCARPHLYILVPYKYLVFVLFCFFSPRIACRVQRRAPLIVLILLFLVRYRPADPWGSIYFGVLF